MLKNRTGRLNSVQKASRLKQNTKWKYIVTVKTATGHHRFRTTLALIIAASPEKGGWQYQVKSDLGNNKHQPAEEPTLLAQIKIMILSDKK